MGTAFSLGGTSCRRLFRPEGKYHRSTSHVFGQALWRPWHQSDWGAGHRTKVSQPHPRPNPVADVQQAVILTILWEGWILGFLGSRWLSLVCQRRINTRITLQFCNCWFKSDQMVSPKFGLMDMILTRAGSHWRYALCPIPAQDLIDLSNHISYKEQGILWSQAIFRKLFYTRNI